MIMFGTQSTHRGVFGSSASLIQESILGTQSTRRAMGLYISVEVNTTI